jgi:hypothetical protein
MGPWLLLVVVLVLFLVLVFGVFNRPRERRRKDTLTKDGFTPK